MPVIDSSDEDSIADESARVKIESSDAIMIRVSDNIIKSPFYKIFAWRMFVYALYILLYRNLQKWTMTELYKKLLKSKDRQKWVATNNLI